MLIVIRIDVGGPGEAPRTLVHSSDHPGSLDMDAPGPGLPVPEFRDPVMVSDFASAIDPGPGGSFGRPFRELAGLHWVPDAGMSRVYTDIQMVAAEYGFSC